jgi:DNA (cytosine-5)-methyltransferase 1
MKGLTMPKDDATLSAASAGSAMRYASVCDGIGAAHVAWQPLGWQCQWTSEIEPFPAAVVEHHYGFRNLGDMTAITEEMLDAPVELLVGGTPCQSFSVAGLRGGLADPRGNLALRFVQLAAVIQPKWIVWENVPGVLSSGKGRDFGTFLGALGELGYGFAYRVLDAQWFGVAQRRRRVFVVGYLGDWRRAAAVLFERESMFGNPPTRGAAWEGVARSTAASLTSSGRGVERSGESRGQDDVVLARMRGFGDYAADGTASALKRREYKDATDLVAEPHAIYSNDSRCDNIPPAGLSPPLKIGSDGGGNPPCIAFPLDTQNCTEGHAIGGRGYGENGDPSFTLSKGHSHAVAFTAKDCGGDASQDVAPTMRAMGHSGSHANGGGQLAVAQGFTFSGYSNQPAWMTGDRTDCLPASGHSDGSHQGVGVAVALQDCSGREKRQNGKGWNQDGTAYTVDAAATQGVASPMAVRRLTPRECERLQGFPDDYTLVEYRKKPAADGPRYRALGNSMAVPVMRWIGERIQQVDRL